MATYPNHHLSDFRRRATEHFRYYIFTAEMAVAGLAALVAIGGIYVALQILGVFG